MASTIQANRLKETLSPSWFERLEIEFSQEYMIKLKTFLDQEVQTHTIYPAAKDTFNAFRLCPLDQLKVVILGQDPYHGPNQAHGLCFSVQEGIDKPPSLLNIFKELNNDLGLAIPKDGDLSAWARQGVFLLNTCLSVRAHQAGSHFNQGWEIFTDKVISVINENRNGVVFMLWGSPARRKSEMIDRSKHLVLEAPHPSPLSAHRGFLGCKHFSQANEYLSEHGEKEIDWSLN